MTRKIDPELKKDNIKRYHKEYRSRPEIKQKNSIYQREYRSSHKPELRVYNREYQRVYRNSTTVKDKYRNHAMSAEIKYTRWEQHLKRKYGISVAEWEQKFIDQGGVCAICKTSQGRMCTDHDHESGKFRGILCSTCNAALHQEFVKHLTEALEYLGAL